LISSYTFGIYPRSEELIEATRKNTENLDSLFQSETEEYISAQKNAGLGFISAPLLKWDDIFRPFSNLSLVTPTALNRIYEMNTFYRVLSFDGSDFPFVNMGNSDDLIIGEWAIALGNPFGLFDVNQQPTATVGIISGKDLDFGLQSGKVFQDMIQTDAAINPGNSGGPLVNANGELIGINTFIFTGSNVGQGSIGIGFAIPINRARRIAEELKTKGRIERDFSTGLRAQPLDRKTALYLDIPITEGVIVTHIMKSSPAEKAQLEYGDVIIAVENEKVLSLEDILEIIEINDLRPGDKVKLRIWRDGRYFNKTLKLGKL